MITAKNYAAQAKASDRKKSAENSFRYAILGYGKRPFRDSYRLFSLRFITKQSEFENCVSVSVWWSFRLNLKKEWREFRLRIGWIEIHFRQSCSSTSTIRGY